MAFHCSESCLTCLERHTQQVVWFIALETKGFVLQRDVRCWIFQANYSPTFEKDSNCAFLVLTVDEYVSKRNEVEEEINGTVLAHMVNSDLYFRN